MLATKGSSVRGRKQSVYSTKLSILKLKLTYLCFFFFSSGGTPVKNSKSPGNRILVRTCDGLELRDPPYYPNPGTQGHELEAGGYNPHSGNQVHQNSRFAY